MTLYLQKSALFPPQIATPPAEDLGLVVVIPAYREDRLLQSLESLWQNERPEVSVEVLVVLNDSEKDYASTREFHQQSFQELQAWAAKHQDDQLRFFVCYHSQLPQKTAGVGLARKIGMDEAVYRLEQSGQSRGIIACFDGDSTCAPNYLVALVRFFQAHPKAPACAIRFAHPLEGSTYSPEIYQAIAAYELHLRYYLQAQRWAGFPLAFHTVGSSMAVRCNAYQAQGGMNRRKAGEDFYFLHKFIPFEHFGDLQETCVFPSPRISDRVPFGTGKSVGDILEQNERYQSYACSTFKDLKRFLDRLPHYYELQKVEEELEQLPTSIAAFLREQGFAQKLSEIQGNTATAAQFQKRFFRWFNAFLLMKYVHFARDHFYPNVSVLEGARSLLKEYEGKEQAGEFSAKELLLIYREMQGG